MNKTIEDALTQIGNAIASLKSVYGHKAFTMDGRLVGDLGEVIAEEVYELKLYSKVEKDYDAETSEGKKIQIKATFKDSLTIKKTPDYYLGLKLHMDGSYEEIYNGPGRYIERQLSHRSGYGEKLIPVTNTQLKRISEAIPEDERISLRAGVKKEAAPLPAPAVPAEKSFKDLLQYYKNQTLPIKKLKGDVFHATIKDAGIYVDNLGNSGFLPWEIFDESLALLKKHRRVLKGNVMGPKLGEPELPLDSLEGHIAHKVYRKEPGSSVFRRITPVANILIWMGLCENDGRYLNYTSPK